MFKESNNFKKFESKVWLSSPTMHGPEIEYVKKHMKLTGCQQLEKISMKWKDLPANILDANMQLHYLPEQLLCIYL